MLTDEEREKLFDVWDIQPHAEVGRDAGVLVCVRATFVKRLGVEEARALALRLWDVADEAEGFAVARTEPSP